MSILIDNNIIETKEKIDFYDYEYYKNLLRNEKSDKNLCVVETGLMSTSIKDIKQLSTVCFNSTVKNYNVFHCKKCKKTYTDNINIFFSYNDENGKKYKCLIDNARLRYDKESTNIIFGPSHVQCKECNTIYPIDDINLFNYNTGVIYNCIYNKVYNDEDVNKVKYSCKISALQVHKKFHSKDFAFKIIFNTKTGQTYLVNRTEKGGFKSSICRMPLKNITFSSYEILNFLNKCIKPDILLKDYIYIYNSIYEQICSNLGYKVKSLSEYAFEVGLKDEEKIYTLENIILYNRIPNINPFTFKNIADGMKPKYIRKVKNTSSKPMYDLLGLLKINNKEIQDYVMQNKYALCSASIFSQIFDDKDIILKYIKKENEIFDTQYEGNKCSFYYTENILYSKESFEYNLIRFCREFYRKLDTDKMDIFFENIIYISDVLHSIKNKYNELIKFKNVINTDLNSDSNLQSSRIFALNLDYNIKNADFNKFDSTQKILKYIINHYENLKNINKNHRFNFNLLYSKIEFMTNCIESIKGNIDSELFTGEDMLDSLELLLNSLNTKLDCLLLEVIESEYNKTLKRMNDKFSKKFNYKVNSIKDYYEEFYNSESSKEKMYTVDIFKCYAKNPNINSYILSEIFSANKELYYIIDENTTDPIRSLLEKLDIPYKKSIKKFILGNPKKINALIFYSHFIKDTNILIDMLSKDELIGYPSANYILSQNDKIKNSNKYLKKVLDYYSKKTPIYTFFEEAIKSNNELSINKKLTKYYNNYIVEDIGRMINNYKNLYPNDEIDFKGNLTEIHDKLVRQTGGQYQLSKKDLKPYKYSKEQLELNDYINGYSFNLAYSGKELADISTDMHHCVGSYCDKVRKGASIIVSVKTDDKYEACIELAPQKNNTILLIQAKLKFNELVKTNTTINSAILEWCKKKNIIIDTNDVEEININLKGA